MNELKMTIDLEPIDDEVIKKDNISMDNLWMIKTHDEKILGPFETEQLKKYAHTFEYLFENVETYNLEDESWQYFYKLPQFQRRKPKLSVAQNLVKNNHFFVKTKTHELGPLSEEDIHALLEKGHVLSSHLLSVDNKQSWIKIYEYHVFDRRNVQKSNDLPHRPDEKILKNTENHLLRKEFGEEDMIASLAFLSHGTDSGLEIQKNPENVPKKTAAPKKKVEQQKKAETKKIHPKYLAPVLALLVLTIIGVNFMSTSQKKPTFQSVKAPEKSINNSERNTKKRSPASVKTKRKRARITPKKRSRLKVVSKPEAPAKYEENNNYIDINDPEIKDELDREFAGGYDELDGEQVYNEVEDEFTEDEFPIEERISHESYEE